MGGVIPHREGRTILGMVDRHGSAPHREKGGREGEPHEKQPSCLQAVSQRGSLCLVKNRKELKC